VLAWLWVMVNPTVALFTVQASRFCCKNWFLTLLSGIVSRYFKGLQLSNMALLDFCNRTPSRSSYKPLVSAKFEVLCLERIFKKAFSPVLNVYLHKF
jgi:hypothetical protein